MSIFLSLWWNSQLEHSMAWNLLRMAHARADVFFCQLKCPQGRVCSARRAPGNQCASIQVLEARAVDCWGKYAICAQRPRASMATIRGASMEPDSGGASNMYLPLIRGLPLRPKSDRNQPRSGSVAPGSGARGARVLFCCHGPPIVERPNGAPTSPLACKAPYQTG